MTLSGLILALPCNLIGSEPSNSLRKIGGYSVRTFSSGELGTDKHVSGFEVTVGGKVVLHKANSNPTSDILLNEGSVRLDGKCLFFCYGEVGDGLDDAYIHAVKLCGDKTKTFTAVVGDDEGLPVLKVGEVPKGWDETGTKNAIQGTFDQIYARE